MTRSTMDVILGVLAAALRTQDSEYLAGLLDQDVILESLHPDQRCDGGAQAIGVTWGFSQIGAGVRKGPVPGYSARVFDASAVAALWHRTRDIDAYLSRRDSRLRKR
jgi:hypothetical protein